VTAGSGDQGGDDADEVVVLGAHEDSINGGASGQAPGADDDASGTTTLIELFKALMQHKYKPSRTVQFMWYAAEEVGLRGSQAIAASYQQQKQKVYAVLQLDMTFYAGRSPVFGIIEDNVNPALTAFLKTLATTYSTLPVATSKCGYGCSDHASWHKAGYAACLPFETTMANSNPNIHSTRDLISVLSLAHGLQFARVAAGFAVELAGVAN